MTAAPPALAPPAWRLVVHERLASTSDAVIAAAQAGEPAGLAVLALAQSAARGRHGRGWESPAGNLHLSLLLRPGRGAGAEGVDAGRLALLAGVALAETVADLLPEGAPLRLKWPNDLLLDGGKLAGVLVEAEAAAPGEPPPWVVVGFGVNLAAAPARPDRPAAVLAGHAAGTVPPPRRVASALLDAMGRWLMVLAHSGFAPVAAAWLARGHAPGEALAVRLPAGRIEGRFAGLDRDGALLIETATGSLRRIATGEVFPADAAREAVDAAGG